MRGPLTKPKPEQGIYKGTYKGTYKGRDSDDTASHDTPDQPSEKTPRAKKGEAWKKWILVDRPKDIQPEKWQTWCQIRALKKLTLTDEALARIEHEAGKAGLSLQQAIDICLKEGWAGFMASWLKNQKKSSGYGTRAKCITQTDEFREELQACCRGEGKPEKLAPDGVTIIVD